MTNQGYLRHPTLRGDTIVFVCDDDLWRVPADGRHRAPADRRARRAVARRASRRTATGSRSSGRDEQHPEVYLMPAEGGPARRMTWLGPDVHGARLDARRPASCS